MLSELMISFLVLGLVIQPASLWMSLLLVPISAIIVFSIGPSGNSWLLLMVFLMIFVGGLMVLLVSVTSVSPQEQSLAHSGSMSFLVTLIFMYFLVNKEEGTDNFEHISLFEWLNLKTLLVLMSLTVLVISILVVSLIIIEFKTMSRRL